MRIRLIDEKEKEKDFDIGMWECMKIGFFSGLGWSLVYIGFWAIIFILMAIFGAL